MNPYISYAKYRPGHPPPPTIRFTDLIDALMWKHHIFTADAHSVIRGFMRRGTILVGHDNYSLVVYEPFIQDTITEYDSRQKLDEWEQGVLDRMESRRKLAEDMVRKSEEEEEDHGDDEDEQDQDG